MTYAPVSNVKSAFMDFTATLPDVNPVSGEGSFTDVFKGQTKDSKATPDFTKKENPIKDVKEAAMQNQSKAPKEIKETKTEDAKESVKPLNEADKEELTDEVNQELGKVITKLAKALNMDEEEILEAMESLGLVLTDLLNPQNLAQLVLAASGEEDKIALVIDENIANLVSEVTGDVQEIVSNVAAAYGVTNEEIATITAGEGNEEFSKVLSTKAEVPGEEALNLEDLPDENDGNIKVTVEVSKDVQSKEVKSTFNSEQTEEAENVAKEEQSLTSNLGNTKNASKEHNDKSDTNGGMKENPFIEGLAGRVNTIVNETTQGNFTYTEVRQIMNQVIETIHVSVKPETSDIEMLLHPESLGTLNVHLSSKDGVVTAQFTAQNELVKNVLETQMVQLKETFENQGMKVDSIEVAVSTNAFTQEYENSKDRGNNAFEEKNSRRSTRRINLNAMDELPEELGEDEALAVTMMEANGGTVDYLA